MQTMDTRMIRLSDGECFKAKYEEYFTALKYFGCRYVEDEEVVCDILQDFWVRLWEQGMVFENEAAFRTYLYRGVRNNCLTYLRDKRVEERRMEEYEQEETEEAVVNRMIEAEVYALVNEVFEELPPATREVYARSLEGKSHREIAEELHIAINTIKRHKNQANHYLRERLERLMGFVLYLG